MGGESETGVGGREENERKNPVLWKLRLHCLYFPSYLCFTYSTPCFKWTVVYFFWKNNWITWVPSWATMNKPNTSYDKFIIWGERSPTLLLPTKMYLSIITKSESLIILYFLCNVSKDVLYKHLNVLQRGDYFLVQNISCLVPFNLLWTWKI